MMPYTPLNLRKYHCNHYLNYEVFPSWEDGLSPVAFRILYYLALLH